MPSAATVSAIIVNYNGAAFIGPAIESLERQTRPPDEIIIVDNASSDGSADLIRTRHPNAKLIECRFNAGFDEGVNIGLRHSTGSYIALLNSDATADHQWLAMLLAVLDRNPNAGVSEGKVYFDDGSQRIDQAGAFFNNLGNYWGRGYRELDQGQYEQETEVAGVTACAMLVRRDALGGEPIFDSSFFMYGEELDLTIRLRSRGWSIIYTPGAVVFHAGMKSLKAASSSPRVFQQTHSNRNRLNVVAKFYPLSLIARALPLLLLGIFYWDLVFLRERGLVYALRAALDQVRFFARGLQQRSRTAAEDAERWRPWMTRHTIIAILRQKWRMD
jgi:GT2 family glycosyltransferase